MAVKTQAMKTTDLISLVVSVVVWYGLTYYLLYALKNPVDLAAAALILLVLGIIGTATCPLINRTDQCKQLRNDLMGLYKKYTKK